MDSSHTQASGRHDIVTFAEDPTTAGLSGGVAHFGFRLVDPGDIDLAIAEVECAGGACSVVASSLPASPTLTSPIRMAKKLRSGSSELRLPPNHAMQPTASSFIGGKRLQPRGEAWRLSQRSLVDESSP